MGPLLVFQGQLSLHRLENTLINIPIGVRRFFNLDEPREASRAKSKPGTWKQSRDLMRPKLL
jgi:hypothetical protein